MMKKVLIVCVSFLAVACSNSAHENAPAMQDEKGATIHANAIDTIKTNAKPMVLNGCYEMVFKHDSAQLNLTVQDTTVSGQLTYNLYQKDKNTGTIRGVLRDTIIDADYTFQSEGMQSVREVIFKIKNNTLVQAFGDLTEKDGKIIFTDKTKLQFQDSNPFIKTDCK